VANGAFAARIVNEDAAHGLRSGGEEMSAIGKLRMVLCHRTLPGFIAIN
jgi:hypothetical protein